MGFVVHQPFQLRNGTSYVRGDVVKAADEAAVLEHKPFARRVTQNPAIVAPSGSVGSKE